MKINRRFLAVAMVLMLALSVCALPSAMAGEERSIIIAVQSGDEAEMEFRKQYIEDPMAEAFPDVKITHEVFIDRQSLQVQVAAGGGPDILFLDGPTDAVEFAKAGRILPLNDYAEQYGWADLFYEWAYGSGFLGDELYSVPNSYEGMGVYYNIDVFERLGLEFPTNAEEVVAVAEALQAEKIIPFSFGNSDYEGAVDWIYSIFMSCYPGPEALKDALEGTIPINDGLILESIEMMDDWWQKGFIGDRKSQGVSMDDILALFADGRAAMMMNGSWAATSLLNTYPECNWVFEPVFELREGVGIITPLATGGVYCINAASKNPDLAAEIINWEFATHERHMESVALGSFQPFPIKTLDLAKVAEMGMDARLVDLYDDLDKAQAENTVGYCAWTFFPSDGRVYLNENTDNVWLGVITPLEYLTELQFFVDKGLEEGTSPKIP